MMKDDINIPLDIKMSLKLINDKIDAVTVTQKEMMSLLLTAINNVNVNKIDHVELKTEFNSMNKKVIEIESGQKDIQQWRHFIRGCLFVGSTILGAISTILTGVIIFLINTHLSN